MQAPKFLADLLPEGLREYSLYILGGTLCVGALVSLLLLLAILRLLFRAKAKAVESKDLTEDLTEYPDLKSNSSDRQLRIEGVPARFRLVVVAPAGTASEVDVDELEALLEQIVSGLGEIYKYDKPRVKVWPTQLSYQGFGAHFHKCMQSGTEDGEQTRWALVAGRIKVGKRQFMLGLALQTIKPNTIGRRTIDSHEWATVLRVRVKD
jgi:hypothetical protein